jgi:hypothetical protein
MSFQQFAAAVSEADRLVRTAPLHNSQAAPSDDHLEQIKAQLDEATSLYEGAVADVHERMGALEEISAATADDDTAHLQLGAPHTPAGAAPVAGDIEHEGAPPTSCSGAPRDRRAGSAPIPPVIE